MSFEKLFLVNGVTVNENLRGQADDLYIEDAIQETTVATAGISAEYGRFGGGVVNVVTKSGGNLFSGSFRDTLNNDNWRTLTPFGNDNARFAATIPAHDARRAGSHKTSVRPTNNTRWRPGHEGPAVVLHRRPAADAAERRASSSITNVPYTFTDETRRFEGQGHLLDQRRTTRFQGAYTEDHRTTKSTTPSTPRPRWTSEPRTRASSPRTSSRPATTASSRRTSSSKAASRSRHFSFIGIGRAVTDLIQGTLLSTAARQHRYWSPTFCGVCDPEKRDNNDVFAKGSYFLSTKGAGSHNIVFGYDTFNDKRFANNHQSGSDYRILGTTSIIRGRDDLSRSSCDDGSHDHPVEPDSRRAARARTSGPTRCSQRQLARQRPPDAKSACATTRTTATTARATGRERQRVQPAPRRRLGSDRRRRVGGHASFAKYMAGDRQQHRRLARRPPAIRRPSSGSTAARRSTPSERAAAATRPTAIQPVFDWSTEAAARNLPLAGCAERSRRHGQDSNADSPNNLEYAGGISRRLGKRATVRADYVYREYRDFYSRRTTRRPARSRISSARPTTWRSSETRTI